MKIIVDGAILIDWIDVRTMKIHCDNSLSMKNGTSWFIGMLAVAHKHPHNPVATLVLNLIGKDRNTIIIVGILIHRETISEEAFLSYEPGFDQNFVL